MGKLWKAQQGSVAPNLLPLQVPLPFEKRRNLIRSNFASGSSKLQPKTKIYAKFTSFFRSCSHTSNEKTRLSRHFLSATKSRDSTRCPSGCPPPPPFLLVNIFQIASWNICTWSVKSTSIPFRFPHCLILEWNKFGITRTSHDCRRAWNLLHLLLNESLKQALEIGNVERAKKT